METSPTIDLIYGWAIISWRFIRSNHGRPANDDILTSSWGRISLSCRRSSLWYILYCYLASSWEHFCKQYICAFASSSHLAIQRHSSSFVRSFVVGNWNRLGPVNPIYQPLHHLLIAKFRFSEIFDADLICWLWCDHSIANQKTNGTMLLGLFNFWATLPRDTIRICNLFGLWNCFSCFTGNSCLQAIEPRAALR